jgi:hypothetical protein
MPVQTKIQLRRDTSANWTSTNPVLSAGEAGFDTTENKIKIGDGTTVWNSLDYASGGSGSITVSQTAPEDPAEGDLWFNSTNALTYIYYDSFWVDLAPAIAGPQGPIGEPGIVVQTSAPTDTDVLWLDSDDPADAVAVPAGGSTGQVLAKATGDDYDTEWTSLREPPSGNAIINGAFEINQRGFTSSTAGTYGFDRFASVHADGTVTYSAQAFTPGTAPIAGYEAKNFARLVTSGQTLANAQGRIFQAIEDVRNFAGQAVTISFFAKAGSGTPKMAIELNQDFGTGGSPSAAVANLAGQVTLSTAWTRYSLTLTLPSLSGKTIGTTTPGGLFLQMWASAGTDFNARTDSLGIQSNTFDIWGVQVEAGSTATAFRRNANSLQGELAACKRYFERHVNQAPGAPGQIDVANRPEWMLFYDEKRAAPSITVLNSTNIFWVHMTSSSTAANTGFQGALSGTTTKQARLFFLVASGISANTIWALENTGPYSIDISAEL